MNRVANLDQAVFGSGGSTTDANRLYSILLDTRASSASESMYDIAEKLLRNEKETSKLALDQLWALKKNLVPEQQNGTIDILINFYQEKINILRGKEEYIRKVSKDSRDLLEEKRKRDSEVANVKQEISDCTSELERLNLRHDDLRIKEQELSLIEEQLKRELAINANEVVNGLYEIIMSTQGGLESPFAFDRNAVVPQPAQNIPAEHVQAFNSQMVPEPTSGDLAAVIISDMEKSAPQPGRNVFGDPIASPASAQTQTPSIADIPVVTFPKSIVKTTRGVVIGEYYYDPKVYKNNRNYIYNSDFFRRKLAQFLSLVEKRFDQTLYAETMQTIQDVMKRVGEGQTLHFEISTNEILNTDSLKTLIVQMKNRQFVDVASFANRLRSKIEYLGSNYHIMLSEQIERLAALTV